MIGNGTFWMVERRREFKSLFLPARECMLGNSVRRRSAMSSARSDRLDASAYIERLDEVARQHAERRWGIGRLPRLVDPGLRLRFDRQREKLNQAVAADNPGIIKIQAEGMARAWQALDKAATAAGALPLKPEIWECRLPASGRIVAIVRTEAEARHVAPDRECWSLAEIALLIERLGDGVRQVKATFPGAAVIGLRPHELEELLDDEIPF